ncbi:uncharacterized protein A1O9_02912 [Exophiala aquamarina CBS 119918]|uniref:Uncharacterized protein n=1 Tax=Exophiala aquamarina CBS 119918 TaxID=1182545 RepID=A0A072PNA0_9EURO|nr:uncharacterized protein A1O9_02912 [Exophiala aquamarina CBS 119918]KEF61346.1 hypothetical protein A1O9_02912 [Exophiala aquamarina CBS 119918]
MKVNLGNMDLANPRPSRELRGVTAVVLAACGCEAYDYECHAGECPYGVLDATRFVEQAAASCAYTAVKIWIFEPTKQRKSTETTPAKRASSFDLTGLTTCAWPSEERYLVRYYMQRTGPWLSHYCDPEAREPWAVTLPRLAISLPALRHLVVATAMMDQKLHRATSQALVVRSERIIFHYNEAIRLLTTNNASFLEVLASAIIAHTLETMIRNTTAARIHLRAAERLLVKASEMTKSSSGSEADHIIANDLQAMYLSAAGYHSTEPAFRLEEDTSALSVLDALRALHSPQGLKSTKEVLFVYERLFERLNVKDEAARPTVDQLRDFTSMWELAILQLSHDSPEPPVNMIAAHMLICVANALVPQICSGSLSEEHLDLQSPVNTKATGYIIRKLFVLMEEDTEHLEKADLAVFNRILKLAFVAIHRFARNRSHRNEAKALLMKVETSGGAEVRTKSPDLKEGRTASFADPAVKFSNSSLQEKPFVLSDFAARKLSLIDPLYTSGTIDLPLRYAL